MSFYTLVKTSGEKVIVNLAHIVMLKPDILGTRIQLISGEEIYVRNKIEAHYGTLDIGFAK